MLLRNRIRFPLSKKTVPRVKSAVKVQTKYNTRQLPLEIQEIICFMVLGENLSSNPFALTAMRVCKTWANFICERMYKQFQFKNYIQFIGFVNTICLKNTILPYGLYVKNVDLSPVNKYGVDIRVRKLIKSCPNVINITFGHTTSVKAETFQLMGRYCKSVSSLEIGGIQSFPFMFDCDFSGMVSLRKLTLTTTPLQSTSLYTLPDSILHLNLNQMDALQHNELSEFLRYHPNLLTLSIRRCKHINANFSQLIKQLPNLTELGLYGPEVDDVALQGLFDIPNTIPTLRLCHTKISYKTLEALTNGRLVVHHLDISNNANISKHELNFLLKKKQFKEITL